MAEENEEFIENLMEEMLAISYENISQNNLQDYTITSFAQSFTRENVKREVPFLHSIAKVGGAFWLGHASQRDRDGADLLCITIDRIRVEIDPPTPPRMMYKKTICIFGIPEEESDM